MGDFALARQQMVDCQIRPNDVTDHDIIAAFLSVPREQFVPQSKRPIAYADCNVDLNVEDGRLLMQVTPFAKMLQAADIKPSDFVLCVGAGCGYGAAVMAKLAESVVAVEADSSMVAQASDVIAEVGIDNLAVIEAELSAGCASEAPFDVIVVEGGVDVLPETIFEQLKDGGRLVAVIGTGLASEIQLFLKSGGDISRSVIGNTSVPRLPGFEKEVHFQF